MDANSQLEIKVIYDAGAPGRRRPAPARRPTPAGASAIGSRTTVAVIGILNLFVAVGGYYGAWWRVDRDLLYIAMMMHTPVPGMKTSDVESLFAAMSGGPPGSRKRARSAEAPPAEPPAVETREPVGATDAPIPTTAPIAGRSAQLVIVGGGYAWLAFATIAIAMLGLACGACLSSIGPPDVRRVAVILGSGLALGAALYATYVARESGMEYKPTQLRTFVGLLLAISVPLGCLKPSWRARTCRVAGLGLVAFGLVSSAGIVLWRSAGAIAADQAGATTVVTVFAVISAWGWVLLAMRGRIRGAPARP